MPKRPVDPDKLIEKGYISYKLKTSELVQRLSKLHRYFKGLDQDGRPSEEFDHSAMDLAHKRLLTHSEANVKLLVACNLSDIIRFYAPDPPYDDKQLKAVFSLFISQYERLSTTDSPSFEHAFYFLERVAEVKSFILLIDIDIKGDMIVDLFSSFFRVINEDHSLATVNHILLTMTTVVQDLDEMSESLMDCILLNLLDENKKSNPAAYRLAQNLITRCQTSFREHCERFLIALLVDVQHSTSEVKEHTHEIIWEINKIAPNVLLSVLPELSNELVVDDFDKRSGAVDLVGEMFAQEGQAKITQYGPLFSSLLDRFNDKDARIRAKLVQFVELLAHKHPGTQSKVLFSWLQRKIHDPEITVRQAVVKCVCRMAATDPSTAPNALLKLLLERTLDKNTHVRAESIQGLCRLYRSLYDNPSFGHGWIDGHPVLKLIPTTLMHTLFLSGSPSDVAQTRLDVENAVEDILLPAQASRRTSVLIDLISSFEDVHAYKGLERIMESKFAFQRQFKSLMAEQTRATKDTQMTRQQAARSMAATINVSETAFRRCLGWLAKDSAKNAKVRRALLILADPGVESNKMRKTRKQLETILQSSGKKKSPNDAAGKPSSAVGQVDVLLRLERKLYMNIIREDGIPMVFSALADTLESGEDDDSRSLLKLLKTLSATAPSFFQHSVDRLEALLEEEDDACVQAGVEILANVAEELKAAAHTDVDLVERLTQFCNKGSVAEAKSAMTALTHINKKRSKKLVRELANSLDINDVDLRTHLCVFAEIARSDTLVFNSCAPHVVAFILDELLPEPTLTPSTTNSKGGGRRRGRGASKQAEITPLCGCKLDGILVLQEYLIGQYQHHARAPNRIARLCEEATPIIDGLFEIIEKRGDVTSSSRLEQEHLRQSAATALLHIATCHQLEQQFGVEQFHQLAWTVQDPCVEVREAIVSCLGGLLHRLRLHPQYLAPLALCAIDPERVRISKLAKQHLVTGVKQCYAAMRRHGGKTGNGYLPDTSVMVLVHLLAHHDWDVSSDLELLNTYAKAMEFLLHTLFKEGKGNFPWVKAHLGHIQYFGDALVPEETERITQICEIGLLLSDHHSAARGWTADTKWDGKILAPSRFFTSDLRRSITSAEGKIERDTLTRPKSVLPADFSLSLASAEYASMESYSRAPSKKSGAKATTPSGGKKKRKKSAHDDEDYVGGGKLQPSTTKQRRTNRSRSARTRRSLAEVSEEEIEDEAEDGSTSEAEEEESTDDVENAGGGGGRRTRGAATRRSTRGGGKRKAATRSMEEEEEDGSSDERLPSDEPPRKARTTRARRSARRRGR